MVTSYGVNQAILGQAHCRAASRLFKGSASGLLYVPGNASTALTFIDDPVYRREIAEAFTLAGIPVASLGTSNLWGNSTIQGRIGALKTYAQSNWGFASGPINVFAVSAGVPASLLWAKANPTLVNKLALVLPAVDMQDIHDNNRGGFAAAIEAAWGGAAPTDANNPADLTADLAAFDIAMWTSSDDFVCVPDVVDPFGVAVGAETHSLGAVGHTLTGLDPQQVLDFFAANA